MPRPLGGVVYSFCADVLRQHGTHLGINPNFNMYSQKMDLEAVLSDAVDKAKSRSDLVSDLDKKTLPVIQRLKALLVFPEHCRGVISDSELDERISIVYPAYEEELKLRNSLDFDSLILKTYELLATFPAFAKHYRTVYPYICVDEFQDTNHAQYSLLRALTGDVHQNLFVVADDDQIIYQWNGASHRRIVEFVEAYSPKVIQLPMNYRCPSEIVDLANRLICHNFLRTPAKKPLVAMQPSLGEHTVRLLPPFADFDDEAKSIAKEIKKLHIDYLDAVIVLARSRKLLDVVQQALEKENVSCMIAQRKDEFESPPILWLHSILRLANERQHRAYLEAVCGTFAQLTQIEIDPDDVVVQAKATNRDYLQHWIKLAHKLAPGESSTKKAITEISRCLGEGRDFMNFVWYALKWLDNLAPIPESVADDPMNKVFFRYKEECVVWKDLSREIFEALGEITLEAFLQELQMHSKESPLKPNTVVLMTIHGAKGKEFDHVYLVGLVDDELPSFQSKQKGDNSPEMEEERRSCFVAITRTIKSLTLSYAESYRGWQKEPSRFLFEMGLLPA